MPIFQMWSYSYYRFEMNYTSNKSEDWVQVIINEKSEYADNTWYETLQ